MKRLVLILALIMVAFVFVHADVYVKTKSHTDAFEMMGQKQPAKDEISEQWIGDKKFAMASSKVNMVVDLTKQVLYMINHDAKTYVETKLPLDMSKLIPPEAAQMLAAMKMTVSVNPTGETKKIGKWNCKGYDLNIGVMMMNMNMKVWATTDVPIDLDMYTEMYENFWKASMGMMQMGEKELNEFKKIKGFHIASEMNMKVMGAEMKANTEVLEITKKPAPSGTYSVPAGYKKQDRLSMADLQKK